MTGRPWLAKSFVLAALVAVVVSGARLRGASSHVPSRVATQANGNASASSTPSLAPLPAAASGSARAKPVVPLAINPDTAIWKVPVLPDDPVRGPSDALVTIIEFSEFESPFAKAAATTLKALLDAYATELRVVWKDNPLGFDAHARPAAVLARRAYAEHGSKAFWQVHDWLFESQPALDDATLRSTAERAGLAWVATSSGDYRRACDRIDRSIELGGDVNVRGIPHFFINGQRLAGAQPLEVFRERVAQALERSTALVAQGVPRERVYETIIENGKERPAPEHRDVPEPDPKSPFRGAATGPVVVQLFAEFPCRACERPLRTLDELEGENPGRVKTVFRYLPASKPGLELVAEAAQEVFERGGSAAFWLFAERVLEALERNPAPNAQTLAAIAKTVGVDEHRVEQALASRIHRSKLAADAAVAARAGIASGPTFVIGGYLLGADPPIAVFKKYMRLTSTR